MPADSFDDLDGFPRLETERLTLREITSEDAPWFLNHFSIDEIAYGQGHPAPEDLDAARAQLAEYITELRERHAGLRWGLVLKEGGAGGGGAGQGGDATGGGAGEAARRPLIGSAGFYDYDAEVGSAELGYDLDPAHWGRGLMSEALTAILDFLFERFGLNRVQAMAMPRNVASRLLLEGLGFAQEGVLRDHGVDELGHVCDDVVYSLLRREWRRA